VFREVSVSNLPGLDFTQMRDLCERQAKRNKVKAEN